MTLTRSERATITAPQRLKTRERNAAKSKRPPNVKADRGRVRDSAYLAWLRRQPCSVGAQPGAYCDGPIQAAHIRTHKPGEQPTGMQRKPSDLRCTSLCAHHHAEQHSMNELRFWSAYGLDPFAVAERLYREFQAS